jgi:hypothetical protein
MARRYFLVTSTCVPAGVDDFIARVEVALCGYGFTGTNSIGMQQQAWRKRRVF